jgi:hypothetical protein
VEALGGVIAVPLAAGAAAVLAGASAGAADIGAAAAADIAAAGAATVAAAEASLAGVLESSLLLQAARAMTAASDTANNRALFIFMDLVSGRWREKWVTQVHHTGPNPVFRNTSHHITPLVIGDASGK